MDVRGLALVLAVTGGVGGAGGGLLNQALGPSQATIETAVESAVEKAVKSATKTALTEMRSDIMQDVRLELISLKLRMPPEETRQKILALEEHARKMEPDFRPPVSEFSSASSLELP